MFWSPFYFIFGLEPFWSENQLVLTPGKKKKKAQKESS
jgi:hypothetical protein